MTTSHPEAGLSGEGAREIPYEARPVSLVGVVAPDSHDAWGDLEDGYVVRNFKLCPWRREGGDVMQTPLLVLERVSYDGTADEDGEDEEWWDNFWEMCSESNVRRLRVRISENQQRSVLISSQTVMPSDLDAFEDAVVETEPDRSLPFGNVGVLGFDRLRLRYRGQIAWNGRTITLSLESDSKGNAVAAQTAGLALWSAQQQIDRDASDFVTSQLLEKKNEDWLDEGEPKLEREPFRDRLQLQAIDIDADGSIQFWYGDGDLFWGHLIVASGDGNRWHHADLQG